MKAICVFCASSTGVRDEFMAAAKHLGHLTANRGLALVYGGGNVGLMGIIADAALQAGGKVIGVIPHALVQRELSHTGLTQLHLVESMHQRKQLMHDLSDGFIALPGGLGTLDELFETLTWGQLGIHNKPVGILNVAGFYDALLAQLDRATEAQLLRPEHRDMLLAASDPTELLDRFTDWKPHPIKKWITPSET